MSFAGIVQFKQNLDTIMNSKTFQQSDDTKKWEIGYRLLNSKYGIGSFTNKVDNLKKD